MPRLSSGDETSVGAVSESGEGSDRPVGTNLSALRGCLYAREQAKERKSGAGEPKKQCFARESVLIDTHYISPKYPLPDTN